MLCAMADEDHGESKSEQAAESHEPGPTLFGRPVEGFVKGGTHTRAHDQMMAERLAEGERRRAIADREREIASKPIEDGGGMLMTNKLTSSPQIEALYVLLKYLTPTGEEARHKGEELQCLADIQMLGPNELQLMLVCAGCKRESVHQQDAQLRIPQSRKRWVLDRTPWDGKTMTFPHRQGQPFFFEGKLYQSAGVVDCEKFTCTACGWSARIDGNRLWPDG